MSKGKQNLNEVFNTAQSNADFLSDLWRPECCDPANWAYVPSTYGIPGVELVGEPGMKLFSELTCYENPGRKELSASQVSDLVDILETEGIRPDRGSMGYYDVDDNSNVNSITRQHASASLNIPGWMFQGLRFENELAKLRFANASNWVDKTYNRQPNPKDVQVAVTSALRIRVEYGETIGKKSVKAEIELQGAGLTDKQKSSLLNKIWGTFAFSAEVNHESRFVDLNNDTMAMLLDKIREEDDWIKDYWDNDDEITIAVNAKSFEARVGSILASAAIAMEQEKPLHILFSVPIPQGKETLEVKRIKFFTMHLASLEKRLMDIQGLKDTVANRAMFPWNHPDCEHRGVSQDTTKEGSSLIEVMNRDYN